MRKRDVLVISNHELLRVRRAPHPRRRARFSDQGDGAREARGRPPRQGPAGGGALALPWARTAILLDGDASANTVLAVGTRLRYAVSLESVTKEVGSPSWLDQGSLPFSAARAVKGPHELLVVDRSGHLIATSPMVVPARDGGIPSPAIPVIHELSDLLVEARPPVECFTGVHPHGSLVLVVIAGAARGRATFVVEAHGLYKRPWPARQVELPVDVAGTRIVACAGGDYHLYVALEGGEIRKWRLEQRAQAGGSVWSWVPEIRMTIAGPEGAPEVQALAVGTFNRSEVVYAVSGEAIHRFGSDGKLDQQIEVVARGASR
jgi:hypothetical protein